MAAFINKLSVAPKRFRSQEGFTLVEVIIAFFIISLITGVVIHSSIMAINTSKINKTKTLALAIINEEIEKMRAMDYDDLGLLDGDPEGILEEQVTTAQGFVVTYDVSWADEDQSYKQVSVSVYKEPMVENLEVITRIYPLGPTDENGGDAEQYPPPSGLDIISDDGQGDARTIVLNWVAPQTDLVITEYKIYRNYSLVDTSSNTNYTNYPGGNLSYTYHVTALYSDGTESGPSNEVYSEIIVEEHPPPQNLQIISDEGGGANRVVDIAWDAPEPGLAITEYRIYRDGSHIGSADDTVYTDHPGSSHTVTYYVTALYEDGEESEPSNSESS